MEIKYLTKRNKQKNNIVLGFTSAINLLSVVFFLNFRASEFLKDSNILFMYLFHLQCLNIFSN